MTETITMTPEQTERYEADEIAVMIELRQQAQEIRVGSEPVEIYTADGIVADVIQD